MNEPHAIEYREALEDMTRQFAYQFDGKQSRPPSMGTGGLSALENAFRLLGWEDPYPCPEASCDAVQCQAWAQAGVPLSDYNYLHLCSDHHKIFREAGESSIKIKKGRGYNEDERAERKKRLEGMKI